MLRLSDSMEEGTILAWLKRAGDAVSVGDDVEIETDKANMVHAAEADGTLIEIFANEGATVRVGEPIARVGPAVGNGDNAEADGAGTEAIEASVPSAPLSRAPGPWR